jgi:hypothetical protein
MSGAHLQPPICLAAKRRENICKRREKKGCLGQWHFFARGSSCCEIAAEGRFPIIGAAVQHALHPRVIRPWLPSTRRGTLAVGEHNPPSRLPSLRALPLPSKCVHINPAKPSRMIWHTPNGACSGNRRPCSSAATGISPPFPSSPRTQ